ncbi:MAG: nucleoside 2-deoxyribosyltransferase [Afipia sp.]|jgi:nucleoside 2-deoxyribosyltransferase|nr:MAG: nucleoside 2-deoxyribosyltransferase [Afipia sp.]
MKIYLAGPLGFSEAGRLFHRHIVGKLRGLGYDVLDPWDFDPSQVSAVQVMPAGVERVAAWVRLNEEIGRRNQLLIDEADAIFAVLDGTDVDSGTAAEIGYAFARGKKIIGYRGDFRLAADNEGSTVNLQVEYFIRASGGSIPRSLEEAMTGLLDNDLAGAR